MNETAIVGAEAEEGPDFLDGVNGSGVDSGDGGDLLGVHVQALSGDDVAEVFGGGGEDCTLGGLHTETCPPHALEDGVQALHHLFERGILAFLLGAAGAGGPRPAIVEVGHAHLPS